MGLRLEEALAEVLEQNKASVYTAMGGVIVSYDASAHTAVVRPGTRAPIAREDGTITHEQLPDLPDVPIVFPCGGGTSITWPLVAGDLVLVIVPTWNDRNFNDQKRAGVDAGDTRTHSLSSCYAIAGVLGGTGGGPPGEIKLGSEAAAHHVALAEYVEALASAVAAALPATLPVTVNTTTGAGTATVAYSAPTGPSRATKVLVEAGP